MSDSMLILLIFMDGFLKLCYELIWWLDMDKNSENEGLRHELSSYSTQLRSISSDLDTFIKEIICRFDEIKKRVENV